MPGRRLYRQQCVPLNMTMPMRLRDQLAELSAQTNLSISDLIRRALDATYFEGAVSMAESMRKRTGQTTIPSHDGTASAYPYGRRGFAGMTPQRVREIAQMGGRTAQARGVGHRWTREEASAAGKLPKRRRKHRGVTDGWQ